MSLEIERKFLVNHIPADLKLLSTVTIHQYYLATTPDEEIRLRCIIRPNQSPLHKMTLKFGSGLTCAEHEFDISESIFLQFLRDRNLVPLTKIRKVLQDFSGRRYEVDIYSKDLASRLDRDSLTVVEVEFFSEEEARAFNPPFWFGEEITGFKNFSNRHLFTLAQTLLN